jgi:hypothetical protein
MSETTQQIIERVGLIPVLRAKSVAQGRAVVDAMIAGGVTVVEVTMTVPGAVDLSEGTQQGVRVRSFCSAPAPSPRPIRLRPPSTPARSSSSAPACILRSSPLPKEQQNFLPRRAHSH